MPAPGVLVEVCDLDSGGPVAEGEGQVVVTLLRPSTRSSGSAPATCRRGLLGADGSARLAGVLGRVGEAVKVKGMFLHPRQAASVMNGLGGVSAWRFVIDRVDHKDELACEVVLGKAGGSPEDVVERVRAAVRSGLRFAAQVRTVESLPDDEAGRIVDARTWD